jgi:hypothetical protein
MFAFIYIEFLFLSLRHRDGPTRWSNNNDYDVWRRRLQVQWTTNNNSEGMTNDDSDSDRLVRWRPMTRRLGPLVSFFLLSFNILFSLTTTSSSWQPTGYDASHVTIVRWRRRGTTNDEVQRTTKGTRYNTTKGTTRRRVQHDEGYNDSANGYDERRRSKTRQTTCLGPLVCSFFGFIWYNVITNYFLGTTSSSWRPTGDNASQPHHHRTTMTTRHNEQRRVQRTRYDERWTMNGDEGPRHVVWRVLGHRYVFFSTIYFFQPRRCRVHWLHSTIMVSPWVNMRDASRRPKTTKTTIRTSWNNDEELRSWDWRMVTMNGSGLETWLCLELGMFSFFLLY